MNLQKIVTTLSVLAAGFAVSKVLELVWRKATGHKPPKGDEEGAKLGEIVAYAALSGGLAALAQAGTSRATAKWLGSAEPARKD
ncbi:conserved hypothetical protein [Beutenbergia cavernae DSM 12333]|uniref:Integral membrane protein n=1 Tax=Beutenbergia cavernae (strain ATCC BAA-8 / DSM 12333 / CCUG 43141 / JCM 11478 / NBRC 16432 / NCIMB 13614 / HKI 0122) TaxID=471853 RepID=C5C4C9_BEUC1|nr:DUF4235 domain-containing protein [Beutenbergia cavernae]ACQ82053.1 conserved hypothetical protein [Beutenbergia cavernae DSM 12333]